MQPGAEGLKYYELTNCKHCRNLTLAKLISPEGYLHAPSRSSLVRSAQKCRLCSLFYRKDRSRHSSRLRLSLAPFNDDDPQLCLKLSHTGNTPVSPMRSKLAFFVYTSIGDPSEDVGILSKKILSNTRSQASFEIAARWIDECNNEHACSTHLPLKEQESVRESVCPSRLIDLDAFGETGSDVRLIDNDEVAKKYVTLSYCWGVSRAFTTTSRSLRLRKTRIAFSLLPKTFQDAVIISRKLHVRYLWIDALCIVQDDLLDWQTESAKMGAIYSMAYLTIAADSGVDGQSGCFNSSSTSQELITKNTPFHVSMKTGDGKDTHLCLWEPNNGARRPTPPEIDGSPLAERAWVCQERILSPRILHYTKSQLFWECRQVLLAEDGLRPWSMWNEKADTVPGLARNLHSTPSDAAGLIRLLDMWYNNVVAQSYSSRKLTRAEDKLTAISGIARAFFRHFRCEYLSGLWLTDLSFGLSWRRRGPASRPVRFRSPSFSWASLEATVEWPLRSACLQSRVTIVAAKVDRESPDAFGRISSCSLTVTGYVRQALIVCSKRISAGGYDLVWQLKSKSNNLLGTAHMDDDAFQDADKLVDCLILNDDKKTGCALILEKIPGSEMDFVRKGVAEIVGYERQDGFFGRTARQTIHIF